MRGRHPVYISPQFTVHSQTLIQPLGAWNCFKGGDFKGFFRCKSCKPVHYRKKNFHDLTIFFYTRIPQKKITRPYCKEKNYQFY